MSDGYETKGERCFALQLLFDRHVAERFPA